MPTRHNRKIRQQRPMTLTSNHSGGRDMRPPSSFKEISMTIAFNPFGGPTSPSQQDLSLETFHDEDITDILTVACDDRHFCRFLDLEDGIPF